MKSNEKYENENAFAEKWQLDEDCKKHSLDYAVWCRMYKMSDEDKVEMLTEYQKMIGNLGKGSVSEEAERLVNIGKLPRDFCQLMGRVRTGKAR